MTQQGLPPHAIVVLAAALLMTAACRNKVPSDTQIANLLRQDFKRLEKVSLGFTKAALQNIHIGEKRAVNEPEGAWEVEVTAVVETRIGGIQAVRPCTTIIRLKRINNKWTLVE